MERFREKIQSLREECDNAIARAETAEAEVKQLNESHMERDQEIISFQNRVTLLEEQLETAEQRLEEAKAAALEDEHNRSSHDELVRKVQQLEEDLEKREQELKDTRDQLRTVDVKAEHLERTITKMEAERDEMDNRYEELNQKYLANKAEFDAALKALDDM